MATRTPRDAFDADTVDTVEQDAVAQAAEQPADQSTAPATTDGNAAPERAVYKPFEW
ncbi:hypothetical protein SEA_MARCOLIUSPRIME_91 [Mycobacterium phage Marcoliusprime]|nr:hypothetical protein SEA_MARCOLIUSPRIME_91 [Mycobacterium phage Marcoliusprime]ASR86634.1 hypothetical protein SEA_DISMALFUNK_93 [Mycobacterium phage DismalFunk]AYB69044.1 hypothetical protein SEA_DISMALSTRESSOR_93 [Mycobacterium phage DismalStressor]